MFVSWVRDTKWSVVPSSLRVGPAGVGVSARRSARAATASRSSGARERTHRRGGPSRLEARDAADSVRVAGAVPLAVVRPRLGGPIGGSTAGRVALDRPLQASRRPSEKPRPALAVPIIPSSRNSSSASVMPSVMRLRACPADLARLSPSTAGAVALDGASDQWSRHPFRAAGNSWR